MGVATVFGTVGVTAALAALEATGAFVSIVGVVVAVWVARHAPDVVFDPDVAPKAIVTREHEDGMSGGEYARRLAIHAERNELKEERIEERRKRQERKAKAGGHGKF